MPAGLLGGLCKGRKEDRHGLRNWENACDEGVGRQCVWKSSLVLVHRPAKFVEFVGVGLLKLETFADFESIWTCLICLGGESVAFS